jgi:transposase
MSRPILGDDAVVLETRRRRSKAERERLLEETKTASVSSVARKHGIAKSLLFRWRRDAGLSGKRAKDKGTSFLPVVTQHMGRPRALPVRDPRGTPDGAIEIELANGHKLRVHGGIDGAALKQVIAALGG